MREKQEETRQYPKQASELKSRFDADSSASHPDTRQQDDEVKQSKWPLFITAAIIGCLVASYFIFPGFQQGVQDGWEVLTSGNEQRISEWVSQFGFWGPFFIVAAMVAQMFLLVINVVALMLVAIIAYGPVWGSVIAVTAVAVASTVGYWIGRGLGEATVSKLIGQKSERKVAGFMDKYGIWAIIIARISPFLSNDAVSLVAGLAGMGYFKFMAATLAGIVPLTILLAWLGEDNDRLMNGLIWVSAVSLAVFLGYLGYKKFISKE
ncbi:putative membrane protein YdjX (TVP38/TMEM64 family) [Pontibacter mucosus]|uniref:TVP38/TMEM64 family membrane protein n=1 Tax=Pontibacter mucosus TaxID=1649266 RepID=A0A2T5YPU7_9BACT|nr:TVP38/TMEM64 family protein [Pontibacter mucosus]PTX21338.1 putative membrane protein YdjX (TVP38/TMEM64 family) [Pontibacter mucosus]